MHSTTQKLIIWTKKPVYRDFSSGKLGKKVGETLRIFPHQRRLIKVMSRNYISFMEGAIPSRPFGRGLLAQVR
ncbi:MAG: hypothetical protein GIS02_05555 [Methanosarcinales archaeon]|uniref:Uncharacterized protein n=1 Tax=Candidatus Ethanoperedens thermophilum TaxID=2766897 RepID=A0A848DAV8_9EURY|nr:hypothetical protein [Candidatus Ethanoperedens thermophilum]